MFKYLTISEIKLEENVEVEKPHAEHSQGLIHRIIILMHLIHQNLVNSTIKLQAELKRMRLEFKNVFHSHKYRKINQNLQGEEAIHEYNNNPQVRINSLYNLILKKYTNQLGLLK